MAAASSGDRVLVPSGTCSWSKTLLISKGITLEGAGVGRTIILDKVPSQALLTWECQKNAQQRITGFEFRNGNRTTIDTVGRIRINCTNVGTTTFRMDHSKLDNLNGVGLRPTTVVGVIDHNTFITTVSRMALTVYDPNWNGVDDRWGDASWAADVTWGSSQFLFVENNTFTDTSCIDGYRGTRAVYRFNTFTNCHVTVHGTESSGRNRGARAIEIYKNTNINTADEDILANIRSGSALIWGNTATNLFSGGKVARLNQDRAIFPFQPFGAADGTNVWDINDPTIYETRTASAGGAKTVSVSSAAWATDQWRGYTIRKTSTCSGNCYAVILSNTAKSITFSDNAAFGSGILNFAAGETFTIRKVVQILDGVGRGSGAAISGGAEETAPPKPSGWNNQTSFPLYEWLNTNNGNDISFGVHSSCVGTCRENEHYYDHVPSATFSGAAGVGVGTLAKRPSKCTAGVWYWSTDEGDWDTTNPGKDGRGYKCTSTNVWTLAYTPYTYPHPLATGAAPNPSDTVAPVPAAAGKLVASKPTGSSIVLTWNEATDNFSAQSNLEYEIRRSATNNISTVATAEANGYVAVPYTAGVDTAKVTGLTASTNYYVNIIVRDEAGNKQAYAPLKITTTAATADNTPPTVSLKSPSAGSVVSGNVVLSAMADDDSEVLGVRFYLDGSVLLGSATKEPWNLLVDTRNISDGEHFLSTWATDAADHETNSGYVSIVVNNLSKTYAVSLDGVTSFRSPGASGATVSASYAVVEPAPGTPLPRGVAIIGFEAGGELRAEASVPASPEVSSGLVYAEMNTLVNTGLAVANKSTQDAVIYYTFINGAGIVAGEGTFTVQAEQQTSLFFSALNVPAQFKGTFKFTSTAPVGVVAIRVTTNELGQSVFTTLPVNPSTGPSYAPVLPLFADGGGWATSLVLTNSSSAQQAGIVQFWGPGSESEPAALLAMTVNGTAGTQFPYNIPPNSTVSLTTPGLGAARVGSVRVIPDAAQFDAAPPSALAILSFHNNKGVIVSEAGVIAQPLGTAFRAFVEAENGAVRTSTGVAMVNPGSTSVTATLQLYNAEGLPVETRGITLPAMGQVSKFIDELFPGLHSDFKGTLSVTALYPIGVTGLRSRTTQNAFLISAIPPFDESEPQNADLFPHVVRGGGFNTQLILIAPPSQGGSGEDVVKY